ncbi:sigma-54-dependent Fis family transcriptional regulator [bacterium (candidate division B38) B3_B38]|nr:MAG: sigma-54-dependent Fis family transcriptional regulator [bacterium (candidate division B38) B3_B38]
MAISANILVIDDEEVIRNACTQVLTRDSHRVKGAESGERGLAMMKQEVFNIVILDLVMPGLSGMDLLQRIREDFPDVLVIVITGYATVESAVEAMKGGAYDYIPKPFTPDALRMVVRRAVDKRELILKNIFLQEELKTKIGKVEIIGKSKPIQEVLKLVRKVAPTDSTVLITGESGTGKELIARTIHQISPRHQKPFVTVDCGALVETLFESELFGHVKGSFTGAVATKYGRFEIANGGSILFDEIGNIGPNIQANLLRAIEEKEITRVGSTRVIKVDVRIMAATNKDLRKEVKEGNFREDLLYRLQVVPINLPPLREWKEDIPLLAEYFVEKFSKKMKKPKKAISPRVMDKLCQYSWPGNVRELENTIERAIVLSDRETIELDDLFPSSPYSIHQKEPDPVGLKTLSEMEKEHIIRTLHILQGNKSKTAERLGIDRKTLRAKMKKYGID